jgi:aspartate/methionine/tyrosine aminotransferase
MTEVCSTTLPQKVLPYIYTHPEYESFLFDRKQGLSTKVNLLKSRIENLDGVSCSGADGAFYATIHATNSVTSSDIELEMLTEEQQRLFHSWTENFDGKPDLLLAYYLLAGAGVCTVPLSGFNSNVSGIRITLLEQNIDKFEYMLDQLMFGLGSVFNRKGSLIQA